MWPTTHHSHNCIAVKHVTNNPSQSQLHHYQTCDQQPITVPTALLSNMWPTTHHSHNCTAVKHVTTTHHSQNCITVKHVTNNPSQSQLLHCQPCDQQPITVTTAPLSNMWPTTHHSHNYTAVKHVTNNPSSHNYITVKHVTNNLSQSQYNYNAVKQVTSNSSQSQYSYTAVKQVNQQPIQITITIQIHHCQHADLQSNAFTMTDASASNEHDHDSLLQREPDDDSLCLNKWQPYHNSDNHDSLSLQWWLTGFIQSASNTELWQWWQGFLMSPTVNSDSDRNDFLTLLIQIIWFPNPVDDHWPSLSHPH